MGPLGIPLATWEPFKIKLVPLCWNTIEMYDFMVKTCMIGPTAQSVGFLKYHSSMANT